jgi:hypothetical protein
MPSRPEESKMTDHKLTRQDEDIFAEELSEELWVDDPDFGNWPELFGVILTLFFIWLTFVFTG